MERILEYEISEDRKLSRVWKSDVVADRGMMPDHRISEMKSGGHKYGTNTSVYQCGVIEWTEYI